LNEATLLGEIENGEEAGGRKWRRAGERTVERLYLEVSKYGHPRGE
jgi:hypothetical protein